MKNSEIRIARIMSENARCEEEEKEINWCIDEAKESKYNPKIKQHIRTFYEAVEWCGLEDQYHKAEKQIEAERAELKTVFKNTFKLLEQAQKDHDELQEAVDEHKGLIERIKDFLAEIEGR